MADDLIYCPSCRHKLQLPAELYGQTVECPQCHNRFAAPVPQAAPPPVVRPVDPQPAYPNADYGPSYANDLDARTWRAAASARAPAIALLVVAIVAAITNILGLVASGEIRSDPQAYEVELQREAAKHPEWTPEQRAAVEKFFAADSIVRFLNLDCGGSLVLNVLTSIGALFMMRLRGYSLALLGSIAALNPFNVPCCLLQAPFGLWALIVLMNGDVRRAFR